MKQITIKEALPGLLVRTRFLAATDDAPPRIGVEGPDHIEDRSYPHYDEVRDPHTEAVHQRMIAYCAERGYSKAAITPLLNGLESDLRYFYVTFTR